MKITEETRVLKANDRAAARLGMPETLANFGNFGGRGDLRAIARELAAIGRRTS